MSPPLSERSAHEKITLPKLMCWIAVLIFIIGAGLGYNAGNKQLVPDGELIGTLISGWHCCSGSSLLRWAFCSWLS